MDSGTGNMYQSSVPKGYGQDDFLNDLPERAKYRGIKKTETDFGCLPGSGTLALLKLFIPYI